MQPRALREALTSGGFGRRHTAGATTAAAGHPLLPGIGGAALAGLRPRCGLAAPSFKTVSPGVLTVAINGDMPMTSVKDGKLIGTDGEMIAMIAQKLGLGAKPALMEWSATVESVRTGRTDIMLGNMGWTSTRAKVLSITNAIYYAGRFFAMKADSPLTKVEIGDLKGHSFGTVTGFTIVPEMKKVPGTTDVKLYDTTDACIRDVVAGRLDYAMLDAPTVDYMILQNPGYGLKQVPVVHDAAFPQRTRPRTSPRCSPERCRMMRADGLWCRSLACTSDSARWRCCAASIWSCVLGRNCR